MGFDVGGPLSSNMAGRVSVTSNDSGSYYYDMYFHQQSLYAALVGQVHLELHHLGQWRASPTPSYRENDGINRVNQGLIDNGTYLTGAPPLSSVEGFGTVVDLTGTTRAQRPHHHR